MDMHKKKVQYLKESSWRLIRALMKIEDKLVSYKKGADHHSLIDNEIEFISKKYPEFNNLIMEKLKVDLSYTAPEAACSKIAHRYGQVEQSIKQRTE